MTTKQTTFKLNINHQILVIKNCPRCGGSHKKVTINKFTKPVNEGPEFYYNYWCMCPVLLEPIILDLYGNW